MKKWTWIVGCCLSIMACSSPQTTVFNVKDYRDENPIVLAVGTIMVQSDVVPSDVLPHIEKKIPITPSQALINWAEHRFKSGRPNTNTALVLTIRDASMIQELKPSNHWYVLDNVVYELHYQLDMTYYQDGREMQKQTVSGFEKKSVPEQSSMTTKEKVWLDLINKMIQKVNRKVIADIPPGVILSEA